jgi:hypothetical protein
VTFNLKKSQVIDIADRATLDMYIQSLISQLNNANAMPTDEALTELSNMDVLSQYGVDSFDQLRELISEQQEVVEQQQNMENEMIVPEITSKVNNKGNIKMSKPFNLKKAQFENPEGAPVAMPGFSDTLVDPELKIDEPDNYSNRKFKDGSDVQNWLRNETDLSGAIQFVVENDTSEKADLVKELIEQFYDSLEDSSFDSRQVEIIAGQIFDNLPDSVKEGVEIPGIQKEFEEINDKINKLAKNCVEKNKSFNLKKTAQHKELENVVLWGPGEKRIDPFLKQPVSDWHIVERNKGFGLVVDDVWNIDYETIWRENIMDKYSRPYKDKEGNWVGGYIQKRFEVDKNIPTTSNMQLKPGEKRRPILPEYGNTEARLQEARSKGEIAGSNDTSNPFNWKEAQSKKKR